MGEPKIDSSVSKKRRLDINSTQSDVPGLRGQLETFLRRFRNFSFILLLSPVVFLLALCMGLSIAPGLFLFQTLTVLTDSWTPAFHYVAMGFAFALAYITYGITLIFVVPLVNFLLPLRLRAWKGIWFSLPAIPWYIHNALTYIVRYTFLEFITPTPLNVLFYRMMGMKIGKGVVINTTNISDPCMISLGDYVTIGGSAHLLAHYGQKGVLIISPVVIESGATIGLKASIMGDVVVGKNAIVKPHTALLPKTRLGEGESI